MKVASFVLAASAIVPALASAIRGESEGVISALLRGGSTAVRRDLIARQSGTCDAGYLPCSDGDGCCPVGQYCGTWGGKPGCCPIGKNCVANDNPCVYVGDVKCTGETFCCPAGDTCYRDTTGAPKCSASGGANPNTNAPTNTIGGNTPSATFLGSSTKGTVPTNNLTGVPSITGPVNGDAPTTTSKSNGFPNPFSNDDDNGALATGVTSFALVAVGVAANILLAAH